MAERISEKDGEEAKRRLVALKDLAKSPGWQLFAPKLEENLKTRLQGCTARARTPEQRAEHIEGYHDALELSEWLGKQIGALEEKVRKYNQQ